MAEAPSFSPELFRFLSELKAHNERAWFNANKPRYEQHVKEPALAFVEDAGYRLPEVTAHLVADRKSMFRIYRDTRFAKDKTPYKTHVGIYFRHVDSGREGVADTAGMYLHLEPRHTFMGAGVWHPLGPSLKRIRTAIVSDPDAWRDAVAACAPDWRLGDGEALKRAPRGFDPEHPLVEDLKRKSFAVFSPLTQREATAGGFLDTWEARARGARPFMEWVSDALGVPY